MTATVEQTTESKPELNPEKQMMELRSLAEMKHKSFSQLLGIHLDTFSAIMVNGNGMSYKDKIQAAQALKEAVMFALDFGLGVTNPKIRQGGKLAKETNGLAGILVQALDNRMLLIADRMNEQEKTMTTAEAVDTVETMRQNGEISSPEQYFEEIGKLTNEGETK